MYIDIFIITKKIDISIIKKIKIKISNFKPEIQVTKKEDVIKSTCFSRVLLEISFLEGAKFNNIQINRSPIFLFLFFVIHETQIASSHRHPFFFLSIYPQTLVGFLIL